VKSDSPKFSALERLKREFEDVKAHLAALTAVVGGITTAGAVNFERLEECVNFAVTFALVRGALCSPRQRRSSRI